MGYQIASTNDVTVQQSAPDVSEVGIVWVEAKGSAPGNIRSRDWATGTVRSITSDTLGNYAPRIEGDTVVWSKYKAGGTASDIYKSDITGATVSRLTNETSEILSGPDVSKGVVVWSRDGEIYCHNGSQILRLTNDAVYDDTPAICNNLVVMSRQITASWAGLAYYDLANPGGGVKRITKSPGYWLYPSIDGRSILAAVLNNGPALIEEVRPYAPAWYESPYYAFLFAYYGYADHPGGVWPQAVSNAALTAYQWAYNADQEFRVHGSTRAYYTYRNAHEFYSYYTYLWAYYAYVERPSAYSSGAFLWGLAELQAAKFDYARR